MNEFKLQYKWNKIRCFRFGIIVVLFQIINAKFFLLLLRRFGEKKLCNLHHCISFLHENARVGWDLVTMKFEI